jgi:hypothetical protein
MAAGRMRLSGLVTPVREAASWCLEVADFYGVPVTVTSGVRSWESQNRLYRNYLQCKAAGNFGKTPDCMFPANPPGQSSHEYGLSWDSVVDSRYQDWWDYVRRYAGFEVLSNDRIHAQVPEWRRYA